LNDTDRFVTVPRVYAFCPPPPDLAPYVRLFWAAGAGPDEVTVERVVADGCCELIVHSASPYLELAGRRDGPQPRAFLYGQLQHAMQIAPTGPVDLVAVRFTPAGVGALFGFDLRAVGSAAVALDGLFGSRGSELAQRVGGEPDRRRRWRILADFLRSFARGRVSRAARVASEVCARLELGRQPADRIAVDVGASWRTIERAFDVAVGLTPGRFAQVRRIAEAAHALRDGRVRMADVAAAGGFADQAHFTRVFRAVVGVTPGAYAREVRAAPLTIVPASQVAPPTAVQ
jgi:AraC-like DNA-binding protein